MRYHAGNWERGVAKLPPVRFSALCLLAACAVCFGRLPAACADTYVLNAKCRIFNLQDPGKRFDASVTEGSLLSITLILPRPTDEEASGRGLPLWKPSGGAEVNGQTYHFSPAASSLDVAFGDYDYKSSLDASVAISLFGSNPKSSSDKSLQIIMANGVRTRYRGEMYGHTQAQFMMYLTALADKAHLFTALPFHFDQINFDLTPYTSNTFISYSEGYTDFNAAAQSVSFYATLESLTISIQPAPEKIAPAKPAAVPEPTQIFRLPILHITPGGVLRAMKQGIFPGDNPAKRLPGVSALVPNGRDNSLIILATSEGFQSLRAIVGKLDIPVKRQR